MNIPRYGRIARIGAALLGGAACLAGEAAAVKAEATSATATFLDNEPVKTADIHSESLVLPSAWGSADAATLVVAGVETPVAGTGSNYLWNTGLVFPGTNTVSLACGGTNFVATFYVGALALKDWGTATLDNLSVPRTAAGTENLTLPATWGETPAEGQAVKVTLSGPFGDRTEEPAAGTTTLPWNSVPCIPGSYTATLSWGSGADQSYTVGYTVAAAGDAAAESLASVDNLFEGGDPSDDADVRDIANHTNVFTLAWGAGAPALTLDGSNLVASADSWTWDTNGLTYALYTFTNMVAGSNYVARFRVNSEMVAALYSDERIDPLVSKTWGSLPEDLDRLSRGQISDYLKTTGENGYPLWKSYMLGIAPDSGEVDLTSEIVMTRNADGTFSAKVMPAKDRPPSAFSATTLLASDTLDGEYNPIKNASTEPNVFVEKVPEGTKQRFYKQTIDVERPLRK